MVIDRLLLSPACYCTAAMPVSLTVCKNVHIGIEHDFCTNCYERPPVLSDHFCWAEGVVAQDRFYCTLINLTKSRTKTHGEHGSRSYLKSMLCVCMFAIKTAVV